MHIKMSRDKRCWMAFYTVVIFTALDILYYIVNTVQNGFTWIGLFIFVLTVLLSFSLLMALGLKTHKPLFLIYVIYKTYDGIVVPMLGLMQLNLAESATWPEVARGISYCVCAFALFLTIFFLIFHEFTHYKQAHMIIEILTLIAIVSALCCIVFATINVVSFAGKPADILSSICELALYISLYQISPLVHEAEDVKEKKL